MRANQFIPEGRVKELAQDLKDKSMSDADFEKKYGKTRADARAAMRKPTSESVAGPEKCWPGHRKVGTQPGTGKNAGKRVNDCEKIKEQGVAEGSLNEFFYDPEGFGDGPEANYPCWDCGSTILGHHTKLCDLAEEWAIRDLPAEPGTQYWTREIPKGLKPIPGLKEGVAEGSEQRWRVTVGNKSGTLSHTKVFTGTKEQAIKQAVRRFATTRDPVVRAELVEQGVAEGSAFDKWADDRAASQLYKLKPATTWEVSYDYGPHMTKSVTVKARSEQEARDKVEKAAEKKGMSIMINSVEPANQGVAEGSASQIKRYSGKPEGYTFSRVQQKNYDMLVDILARNGMKFTKVDAQTYPGQRSYIDRLSKSTPIMLTTFIVKSPALEWHKYEGLTAGGGQNTVKVGGKKMKLTDFLRLDPKQQDALLKSGTGVAEGLNDTVGFSVNSEAAYQAVMARFGDSIDHDETSGIMYVPERMWPQVEVVAFDADGEGAVQVDGLDEGSYDRDDYYNARRGSEYGRGLAATGYGGDSSGTRRDDIFKGQSKRLPADPFARTTGAVPTGSTGRIHSTAQPGEMDEGEKIGGRHDADDFDDMVLRLKKLAGAGPMKTVYDPDRRVYRNMPTAQQPPQQPKK